MRVLVTGAAGRVGSKTVDRLLGEGFDVVGFDIRDTGKVLDHYSEIVGSFTDVNAVRDAVRGVDTVIHLGAFMSWRAADAAKMFEVNVDGTRALLECAAAAKVDRFVFASSGEVYPENAPVYLPVDEAHPLRPNSQYGLGKKLAEEMVRFFERTTKLNTVILRFSHTQDASELLDRASFFSGPRFFLAAKIEQQESFGNDTVVAALKNLNGDSDSLVLSCNEEGRPFKMHITDTRDMVEGIVLAATRDEAPGEVFNLGHTVPVEFSEALTKMAELTGLPVVRANLPGEGVFYETSNQKMRTTLGFEPVWSFDKMLDEAVEHFGKNKH